MQCIKRLSRVFLLRYHPEMCCDTLCRQWKQGAIQRSWIVYCTIHWGDIIIFTVLHWLCQFWWSCPWLMFGIWGNTAQIPCKSYLIGIFYFLSPLDLYEGAWAYIKNSLFKHHPKGRDLNITHLTISMRSPIKFTRNVNFLSTIRQWGMHEQSHDRGCPKYQRNGR